MFQIYDVVVSKEKLSSKVPEGTLGTVLLTYEHGAGYEVEFVSSALEQLDILTVSGSKLFLAKVASKERD